MAKNLDEEFKYSVINTSGSLRRSCTSLTPSVGFLLNIVPEGRQLRSNNETVDLKSTFMLLNTD